MEMRFWKKFWIAFIAVFILTLIVQGAFNILRYIVIFFFAGLVLFILLRGLRII